MRRVERLLLAAALLTAGVTYTLWRMTAEQLERAEAQLVDAKQTVTYCDRRHQRLVGGVRALTRRLELDQGVVEYIVGPVVEVRR